MRHRFYRNFAKRALDLILSGVGIAVLSPLFAGLCLAVALDSRGPIFFAQKRIGRGRRLFSILKFRTMRADTPHDVPTHQLADPERYITRVGRFLRRSSLDELPQLFNIFIGQMSIVGPRPALFNQYDLADERDKYGVNEGAAGRRVRREGFVRV